MKPSAKTLAAERDDGDEAMGSATFAEPLPWQQPAWAQLLAARRRDALSHGWLITGPAGVGKRRFAAAFAASLLCARPDVGTGKACTACAPCRMLAVGGHPDAHRLGVNGHLGLCVLGDALETPRGLTFWAPDGKSKRTRIAVDAIRSLIEKLATVAHLGGERVVLLEPASDLNDEATNALLKTLEEPPPRTTLLFVSEYARSLKPTLRSRCQLLRFAPPPRAEALAWLRGQGASVDAELLDAAGGAPLRALDWLARDEPARRARWRSALDAVATRRADPLATAQELSREKEEVDALLRFWQGRLVGLLREQPPRWSARHESFLAHLIDQMWRLEETNANAQLVLEGLLLRWRALTA